jgi:hypothetical protein
MNEQTAVHGPLPRFETNFAQTPPVPRMATYKLDRWRDPSRSGEVSSANLSNTAETTAATEAVAKIPTRPTVQNDERAQAITVLGSPEWAVKNVRRSDLIRKKIRGGLSSEEEIELEKLQAQSLDLLQKAYPRPPVDSSVLDAIEKRLG